MSDEYRIERDSMGEVRVPADALWRAQTQRAIENFPISGTPLEPRHVRALGAIKAAAAGQVQLSPQVVERLLHEVKGPEAPQRLGDYEQEVLRGAERMTALLRPTLGPLPRTVAVAPILGNDPPEILDSAATIARRTIQLRDPFEDMGAMLVRHLVEQVFEAVIIDFRSPEFQSAILEFRQFRIEVREV